MTGRAPLAVACFVVGVLVGVLLPIDLATRETSAPGASAGPSAVSTLGVVLEPPVGLPIVDLDELPPEAARTVELIDSAGPFPNPQDGSTFQNREGRLPERPERYYREYTVPGTGNGDRGALRIVTGADGELYWTADHYDSFAWINR